MKNDPITASKQALLKKWSYGKVRGRLEKRITPRPATLENAPLSFAQQRLWFLDQLEPNNLFYNIETAIRLSGVLKVDVLTRALNEVVRRHEILRTRFETRAGVAVQVISPALTITIPLVDLSRHPSAEREAEAGRWIETETALPFDLATGPLIRANVLRLEEHEHLLLLTLHHIVADGWSIAVLMREVGMLYNAFARGLSSPLPPLPIQYADFAYWQRNWLTGQVLEKQLQYWRDQLHDAPALLELPTDRPRPAVPSYRGATLVCTLPHNVTRDLVALAQSTHTTLFMVLSAAFKVLLSRYSGQTDICIGTPITNRGRAELEPLIGLFVNTLVLRAHLGDDPAFTELLSRVRATALAAFAHQDIPFEQLVGELNPTRSLSYAPLFQAKLAFHNVIPEDATADPSPDSDSAEIVLSPYLTENRTAKLDLSLDAEEDNGQISVTFEYSTDLFDRYTIERMMAHFQTLCAAVAANPAARLSDISLLTPFEKQQLLVEWNQTECSRAPEQTIHHQFEVAAGRTSDAPALWFDGTSLTYAELNAQANQLAHYLRSIGVGPDVRVGLCMERSPQQVMAMLGIVKAGGAYVPLDPAYPEERLTYMLQDAQPAVILTDSRLMQGMLFLVYLGIPLFCLDQELTTLSRQSAHNPAPLALPDHLAYVIYTSGSSGKPKGVLLSHRGLCNLVHAQIEHFGIEPRDRVLQFASFNFDASVSEIFVTLGSGACLCLAPTDHLRPGPDLNETIKRLDVTAMTFPPAALVTLEAPANLRTLVVAGEACPPALARQWATGRRLINAYGPTEATVCASIYHWIDGRSDLPIGKPIANTALYILDRHLNPQPIGVPGELYIAGVGLARGYLNRADLTAERFIPNPFGAPGQRMYKTGDIARYLGDGNIEYLGRLDHQVKIRGFRIELGEIETALRQLPPIREAVAVVRESDSGEKQLVAYVVGEDTDRSALRSALSKTLPEYMLPSHFVSLGALPLNANGKVDRQALPVSATGSTLRIEDSFVAPRNPTEQTLAGIWTEVLGLQRVGAHDNFFNVGGDSIIAIQIIARAREAGLALLPRQIFQTPTVAELANAVGVSTAATPQQDPVEGEVRLIPIQRWFFEQALPVPQHYNQSVCLTVRQPLDREILRESLAGLVRHHDALRLCFTRSEAGWRAVHAESPAPHDLLTVLDLSTTDTSLQEREIEQACNALQSNCDLSRGPLFRALYIEADGAPGRLLLVCHHLAVDGVSWRILLEDLQNAYFDRLAGKTISLPTKSSSFQAWGERLLTYSESEQLKGELPFWRETAASAFPLPVDFPNGSRAVGASTSVSSVFAAEETKALLSEVPAAYRTQINDALLTALVLTFSEWIGAKAVCIDLEGHGREDLFMDIDLSRTVGWFTSLYPVHLQSPETASGDCPDYSNALKSIKEQLRAVPNKGIGYGVLRYLANAPALQTAAPAGVAFNYLGQVDQVLTADGPFAESQDASGSPQASENPRPHEIEINAIIVNGCLDITWSYSAERFKSATVERLSARYLAHLTQLVAHCRGRVRGYTPSDFPLARLAQSSLDSLYAAYDARGNAIEDIYPLTPLQQGLLFHALMMPGGGDYVVHMHCQLGDFNRPHFTRALETLLSRHAMLRTAFCWEGLDAPVQIVHRRCPLPLSELDWRTLAEPEQDAAFQAFLAEDRRRGFALSEAPLLRLTLIRLGESTSKFVWSSHHILYDGWSFARLMQEFLGIYGALSQEAPVTLPPVRPYRDYLAWLATHDLTHAERYWRRALAGFRVPTPLVVDRHLSRHQSYVAQHREIDAQRTAPLIKFAREHALTISTIVQGAWAILWSRYAQRNDVLFGVTVSGRPPELSGIESMTGLFINSLPLRVRIDPSAPLGAWLQNLQAQNVELRQYEHTPLAAIQGWSGVPRGVELFNNLFTFENYPIDKSLASADQTLPFSDVQMLDQTHYPLRLNAAAEEQFIALDLRYDQSRFDEPTIERMLGHLEQLLNDISTNPNARVGELSLLTPHEKRQLLVDWNDTVAERPVYILDESLDPVPIGIPGELYIGGDGLARGYVHRPDLTAERFIPNPFGPPGTRLYKSGDRARYLADGDIEHLGRFESGVTARGHHGEIETKLALEFMKDF